MAFDLETAKVLPKQVGDLLAHRPLGIACAAAVVPGQAAPVTWHGMQDGKPSARMSRAEVGSMVEQLTSLVNRGLTLVTWNGLAFDFDVLAEESRSGSTGVDHAQTTSPEHASLWRLAQRARRQ